jgi:N,N'-diacetyllegionaminate synthase
MSVRIGDYPIGQNNQTIVVAEIGPNHDGSVDKAMKLIDAAAESGCQGVKFQYHLADAEIHDKDARSYYYDESRYEFIKRVQEFPHEIHRKIRIYCKKKGLLYICSVFSENALDRVADLQPDAYKIPSGETNNPWVLEELSKCDTPVIASSGMSSMSEIDAMMEILTKFGKIPILLHCVSEYPTTLQDMNLRMIRVLRERFGCPVGLSDHSRQFAAICSSVALGAALIELHFTFDRSASGPDHKISVLPSEMSNLVQTVRDIEAALGSEVKKLGSHVDSMRTSFTNSIVARKNISKGEILTKENLTLKKPALGLPPSKLNLVLGKTSLKDISANELIMFEHLQ